MANAPTTNSSSETPFMNGANPSASPETKGVAALDVEGIYVRLFQQMRLDFQRELAKIGIYVELPGLAMSVAAARDISLANARAGTTTTAATTTPRCDEDDEDEADKSSGSEVELPSPADPDRTGRNAAIDLVSAKNQKSTGGGALLNGNGSANNNINRAALQRDVLAGQAAAALLGGAACCPPPPPLNPRPFRRALPRMGHFMNGQFELNGDEYELDENGDPLNAKPRERASKLEFKRLDHLYNKNIHDFYLTESTKSRRDKDDKWEEYIFVVRRRFDWQNKYQSTTVDIKSPELTPVLREIFKDIKGVSLHEDKPSIDPNLLFNYLGDLKDVLAKEKALPEESQNKAKVDHLALLCQYIDDDYRPIETRLRPLLEHHEITFDLLWALFLPNTLLYTTCSGSNEPRCVKLGWGSEKYDHQRQETFFCMDCHYIDYDGKTFGEAKAFLDIPEFVGSRRIDSLPVFPLAYHEEKDTVTQKLVARGRKFGSLNGMHYKFYKGLAFFKKKQNLIRLEVNSRIVVDSLTFRRMNPNYITSPVKPGAGRYAMPGFDDTVDNGGGGLEREFAGSITVTTEEKTLTTITSRLADREASRLGRVPSTLRPSNKQSLVPGSMTEEQLLLCSPTVLGFSFGDKMWVEFAIEHIRDIVFNPGAFDSLVLPEGQKKIVRALVESHSGKVANKKSPGIDDIIRGKGQGLVAVLHGRPGVGKTLTAEGISEYLQKPLYMVSAGELGTDSRQLEVQLSRILDMCYGWGAVLLLDEADVFLERRSVHELHRNALVSVFLRLLEYFQGILFLTTNRVETFDEAFQSRIHIALRYSDLDRKAKRIIWKTFLDMVAREELSLAQDDGEDAEKQDDASSTTSEATLTVEEKKLREIVTSEELETLARRELNGRQIKNVVRTAQALAGSMMEPLSLKHLTRVLEVTEQFEHDLKGTGQIDGMMSYA